MIKTNPALLAREMLSNDRAYGVELHSAPEIENQVTSLLFSEAAAMEIEYDEEYAFQVSDEYYKLANETEEN